MLQKQASKKLIEEAYFTKIKLICKNNYYVYQETSLFFIRNISNDIIN